MSLHDKKAGPKRAALFGMLIALAFILSYIESLFPLPVPVPGIKVGLANLVVVVGLYLLDGRSALFLSLVRVLLVGFTFGNPSAMMFGLAGGLLSWACMAAAKRKGALSMRGVSILGGCAHNVGQIGMAALVLKTWALLYYVPFLLAAGLVTGAVIGVVAELVWKGLKKYP